MRPLPYWFAAFTAAVVVTLASAGLPAFGQLRGTVQTVTIQGPVTGLPVVFSLYLPEGYTATARPMPVIYHLHGIGGAHNGQQISSVPASYEQARAAGVLGPAIIVFPDGYSDSFWADSATSTKQAEKNVLEEIIPFIEANYRAIADRDGRVIQGFSMGGFGAMKFATKRPDLFACVVAYDAAMVTWPTMLMSHPQQAAEIFGSSEAYYNQFSAWYWSGQNTSVLTSDVGVRMVVGALVGGNRNFQSHLQGLSIPVEYVETGLAHTLGPILDAQGRPSWEFIAEHILTAPTGTCPLDLSGNGQIDADDIFAFLILWFAAGPGTACVTPPTGCPGDWNADGTITADDIFAFLTDWFAAGPGSPCP